MKESIQNLIYEIRGQKVMLDADLAMMYQSLRSQFVTLKIEREENLMSQIATSSWGGTRKVSKYLRSPANR